MHYNLIMKVFSKLSPYNCIWLLFIVNIIFIGLAIYFYNGHFLFWEYPLSYAGMVKTYDGAPNIIASRIYSVGMILSGLIAWALANNLDRRKIKSKGASNRLLFYVCGLGFIIAGFSPDDTRHIFHVIGSALFVATLWIITTNYLFKLRDTLGRRQYLILQITLQVPIFTYAITYFSDMPIQSLIQKFTMIGIIILLYAMRLSGEAK